MVGDVGSPAGNRANDAVALQILVGARDRVGADAEPRRKAAHRRHGIVRPQGARGDSMLHLRLDLPVEGKARLRVDVQQHDCINTAIQ